MHPLSSFLSPWFATGTPDLASLNAVARQRDLKTGGGLPLVFSPPQVGMADGYEELAFNTGVVLTRSGDFHDMFNALAWLSFPQSKATINRRHVQTIAQAKRLDSGAEPLIRGPLRDALTQFDECGVVMVGTDESLWQAIRAHRWREAFVTRREDLRRSSEFFVFGHASHDALRAPFMGLCGKATFITVTEIQLAILRRGEFELLDTLLAHRLASMNFRPRDWQPLPLLGLPGATPDNEQADYYDNTRQFRPARLPPGRPPRTLMKLLRSGLSEHQQ